MHENQRPEYQPRPETIAKLTAEIRSHWSPSMERNRRGLPAKRSETQVTYEVPVIATASIDWLQGE